MKNPTIKEVTSSKDWRLVVCAQGEYLTITRTGQVDWTRIAGKAITYSDVDVCRQDADRFNGLALWTRVDRAGRARVRVCA